MNQQTAFAVPKDRQPVTVILAGGEKLEGVIFLEYAPEERTIHHRIAAFLEDAAAFFPLSKANGGTELINKKNIRLIELHISGEDEKVNAAIGLMLMIEVTAVFTDNTSLTGSLIADVPVERARLSDCLNLPDRFLNIKVGGSIFYINKESLLKVI